MLGSRILDRFHFELKGSGPRRVVFLHGLMGSFSNWKRIVSALGPEFTTLSYDQRGHGRSFQPEAGYAPLDFAEDLKHVLESLGWDSAYIVGHSMGGRAAIAFAYHYPQSVERLVIEDIGPGADAQGSERIAKLLG